MVHVSSLLSRALLETSLILTIFCGLCVAILQNDSTMTAPHGISIEMLDSMRSLPGGISALPLSPPIPIDNPQTQAKIELGTMLFFDKRLSRDGSLSCATCHDPLKDYSDGRPHAVGMGHRALPRHSQTLLNSAYNPVQFWDGRAHSLEEQAGIPILANAEMGIRGQDSLVLRLQLVPGYRELFRNAFGDEVSFRGIVQALAAFERTLITPDSPFDRYMRGDKNALNDQEKRGLILFFGKASCTQCHGGPNFTDNKFHSLGALPGEERLRDVGRFSVSHKPADRGAFKTPSLRNVAGRGPYMHNGSIATLAEVIALYDRGGGRGRKSDLIVPLNLSSRERVDLEDFLRALDGTLPSVKIPDLPADAHHAD